MTRALAALILLAVAIAAIAASDRAKPMIVDAHSSGQWDFNNADYPVCVTVQPGPFKPPRRSVFNPKLSEKV